MRKKGLAFVIIAAFVCSILSLPVFATAEQSSSEQRFSDVAPGSSGFEAINSIAELNIVGGFGDGTFRPDLSITRAQFSKMMVLALDLALKDPDNPTFKDVKKEDAVYKFVESAKYYLTGFRTSKGDYFKSNINAVREDMAVALVKAMDLQNEEPDLSLLDKYYDSNAISPNLKKYIAIAIKHKIMVGTQSGDKWSYNPQSDLTRGQAAILIYNVLKIDKVTYDDEEKITYDDDNVPMEETNDGYIKYTKPEVSYKIVNGKLKLTWKKISDSRLQGYKVVVSKSNSKPAYPNDGYLYWITDKNKTYAYIDNSSSYNGGDFGTCLVPGEKYYFSVTAVYNEIKLPGNVLRLTYSGDGDVDSDYNTPTVYYSTENGKLRLKWNKAEGDGFNYYKVVISKNDSTPKYPENGYLYCISDINTTSAVINPGDGYNSGDFGQHLVPGQKYYFSVTFVFGDKKTYGNVLNLEVPHSGSSDSGYNKPIVSYSTENGKLRLKWNKAQGEGFSYYKVVISKNDSTPKYPENGYLYYITDRDTNSAIINSEDGYNGGDFDGHLVSGQKYYFSITFVYGDRKIAGNALYLELP